MDKQTQISAASKKLSFLQTEFETILKSGDDKKIRRAASAVALARADHDKLVKPEVVTPIAAVDNRKNTKVNYQKTIDDSNKKYNKWLQSNPYQRV